jgi:hypothetical protein
MNISEDQFRLAIREVATEIADASAPPLSLAPRTARRPARTAGRRARWLRLAAPLAAAAAVIAVIAGSITVASRAHAPAASSQSAATAQLLRQLPPYYLALSAVRMPTDRAVIRNTRTGAPLATFRPPRPYSVFTMIAGTASGLTFVLAAGKSGKEPVTNIPTFRDKLFIVHVNPATGSATMAPLPIPVLWFVNNGWLSGLALSANGTRLAVANSSFTPASGQLRSQLRIYSVATGAVQAAWQAKGEVASGWFVQITMTWTPNGRALAFNWSNGTQQSFSGLRLLNTTGRGGNLISDSRLLVPQTQPNGYFLGDGMLIPDGTKVIANVGNDPRRGPSTNEFAEFSAATGRILRAMFRRTPEFSELQAPVWSSPSGQVLVVQIALKPRAAKPGDRPVSLSIFEVLRGDRLIPIPGAPASALGEFSQLAF